MDDSLENPATSLSSKPDLEGDDDLSGEEEDIADWTKFSSIKFTLDKPIIPKRGEKDFEPTGGPSVDATGSNLQSHTLNRARDAMYSALKAERGISSKSISYGLWFPATAHTELSLARGTLWTSMGYSNSRTLSSPTPIPREKGKDGRRVELLPEEALYMIERGSMYCWKVDGEDQRSKEEVLAAALGETSLDDVAGSPLSVQQAYAEMLGPGTGVTPEHYQVYSYFKRLGYVVIRAQKPPGIPSYPIAPAPNLVEHTASVSTLTRISNWVKAIFLCLISPFRRRDWWQPLGIYGMNRWTLLTPAIFFRNLRVIPSGHKGSLHINRPDSRQSPYTPFYHVYKPTSNFKKSEPPAPDFQIVVINARSTPLPSLIEMSSIFDVSPLVPLPPPRRRILPGSMKLIPPKPMPSEERATHEGILSRLVSIFRLRPPKPTQPTQNSNPFMALKAGKKNFVVAAVDCGGISFVRFSQGCFEDWPMV